MPFFDLCCVVLRCFLGLLLGLFVSSACVDCWYLYVLEFMCFAVWCLI